MMIKFLHIQNCNIQFKQFERKKAIWHACALWPSQLSSSKTCITEKILHFWEAKQEYNQ